MAGLVIAMAPVPRAFGEEVVEVEPNDTTAQATVLAAGQFGKGDLPYELTSFPFLPDFYDSETDTWQTPVDIGALVFVYADPQESINVADSALIVLSQDGTQLERDLFSDGPPAGGGGSVVAGAVVIQDGSVFFEISGPPSLLEAAGVFPYRLYQATVAPSEGLSEVEGNDSPAAANPVSARLITGSVSGTDVDHFKVLATAGARLVVIVDDNPDDDATNTDTELSLLDTDGASVLADGDNVGDGGQTGTADGDGNAAGAIVVPTTGVYFIRIAHGGEAQAMDDDYRFVVLVDGSTNFDFDTDGVADSIDNCPNLSNPDQADVDGDGKGEACDNCPGAFNADQADADGDGKADTCDNCPNAFNADQADADGDGKGDACDNCLAVFNADQTDMDADGVGDACAEGPGGQPVDGACGTCAPGVFPVAGFVLPACLIGKHFRRNRTLSQFKKRTGKLI